MPNDAKPERSHAAAQADHRPAVIDPLREVHGGWGAFSDGDYASSATHFARVMTYFPMIEEARVGLREALKSQGWLYRLVRPLCFRVKFKEDRREFSEGIPVVLDILAVGTLLAVVKPLAGFPAAMLLVTALWLIPVSVVRAISAGAAISLRTHPEGRLVLSRAGVAAAGCALGWLAVTLILSVMALASRTPPWTFAAILAYALARPVEIVTVATAGIPRAILSIYTSGLVLLAATTVGLAAQRGGDDWQAKLPARVGWLLLLTVVGVVCTDAVAKLVRGLGRPAPMLDRSTGASDPGGFRLSHHRLRRFHPELYGLKGLLHNLLLNKQVPPVQFFRNLVAEHLAHGDSRAAIVMSTSPLLVAAYSDDLDCAVLLEFDRSFVKDYGLRTGSHLVTVNTYTPHGAVAPSQDIAPGPQANSLWADFEPFIADFLVDDVEQLAQRKNTITQAEWTRAYACGTECLKRPGLKPRSGAPLAAFT